MRAIILLLSLSLVAFAGCADSDAVQPTNDETIADDTVRATDTTGVIRGVVVDNAIAPIVGAKVAIKSLELETESLEDGSFAFSDLEPGVYFLDVRKLGYTSVQASATVEAGIDKPPVVRIQLEEDLESLPFSTVEVFAGYLQCGAGFGGVGALNPCALTESVNTFDIPALPDLNTSQLEMVWKGTNAFGDGLGLGIYNPSTTASDFVGVDGGSPLVLRVAGDAIEEHYGKDMESYLARVFPGAGSDVGTVTVVLEQRFEIFANHSYGFAFDEGWLFIEDGEHPIDA